MVLKADDELRHPSNDDYHWRESLYFNFNDAKNGIGGWIYLWVVPNQEKPSGMLVSLYHGQWPDLLINDKAMDSPGHLAKSGDAWVYCYKEDVDFLLTNNFDDVELCGLHLKRQEPLKRYALAFDDGSGASFDLQSDFMVAPYDYADGVNPTPPWLAANRYHRSHWIKGTITIAGKTHEVDCTGDSDHSWGQRNMPAFGANLFKMWSFQTADGQLSISVLKQGVDEKEIALGFVAMHGKVASAAKVETSASFDEDGVQHGVELEVTDELGRVVRARLHSMHSFIGSGDAFWGYEGVGDYQVEGFGTVPGLISYFWPKRITPAALHAGDGR
jgi:hypothetical protein